MKKNNRLLKIFSIFVFAFTFSIYVNAETVVDFSTNENLYDGIRYELSSEMKTASGAEFNDTTKQITFDDITKVTELILKNENDIEDISQLSKFTGLNKLLINHNWVKDVTPILNLNNLTSLDLMGNKISNIDVLKNAKFGNLTYLNLCGNDITDISVLSKFTNLKELDLSVNNIESIKSLTGLTNLEELDLSQNLIIDLNLLSSMENYETLNINYSYNDLKKSGLIKSIDDFVAVTTKNIGNTGDVSVWMNALTFSYNDESAIFNINNNILEYSNGSFIAFVEFLNVLTKIDYDINDLVAYMPALGLGSNTLDKSRVESFNVMLGKFGKYINFTATYDEKNVVESINFTFDLSYFFDYEDRMKAKTIYFSYNEVLYNAIKNKMSDEMKTASGATFSDSNKMISFTDITKVTQLELAGCNITNISQLSNFNSLIKLNLANNNIEDISALSELSNLQVLDLSRNRITTIKPLIELTKLSDLRIYRNLITDLSLLKNIENYNSINEQHYYNDLKKSGLVSNWDEFANEISNTNTAMNVGYTVNHTNDSLTLSKNGEELIKLTRNNNILRYSGSSVSIIDFINLLFTIDYDIDDVDNYIEVGEDYGLLWNVEFELTRSHIDVYKNMLSKFNDNNDKIEYVSFDVTYDDNRIVDSFDFVLDMDYFFNYGKTVNPYTGVSNVLVLVGITLMCSAIGFIVLYKHKTGIQL